MTFRFQGLDRRLAQLLLFVVLAMSTAAAAWAPLRAPSVQSQSAGASAAMVRTGMSDVRLYDGVRAAVASGENYYAAAATLHRQGNFPLKPSVTVRPPSLAWMSAALGETATLALLLALAVATACLWGQCAVQQHLPGRVGEWTARMVTISVAFFVGPMPVLMHEFWAAILICLSLACWTLGWVRAAVLAGFAAALLRELAAPFLLLMAILATVEGRGREALQWTLALGAVAVALLMHVTAVAAVVLPTDLASPGWQGFGGFPFFVQTAAAWSLLMHLPASVAFGLVPLALFGWMSWSSPLALRVTGLLSGYAVLLMVFARPDNQYWAVLFAPLVAPGLVLAGPALLHLAKCAGVHRARAKIA